MIKTVILARETPISLKDFRAQLLGAEGSIKSKLNTLSNSMSAMNKVKAQILKEIKGEMVSMEDLAMEAMVERPLIHNKGLTTTI